jgi:hypothetical protein
MGLICNKVVKLCVLCKHKKTCREDLEHELEKIRDSVMTFMVDGKAVSYKEFMSKLEEMRER